MDSFRLSRYLRDLAGFGDLAGFDAVTPASAKLARCLAALLKLSNAAVTAASCVLIAVTATSLPAVGPRFRIALL